MSISPEHRRRFITQLYTNLKDKTSWLLAADWMVENGYALHHIELFRTLDSSKESERKLGYTIQSILMTQEERCAYIGNKSNYLYKKLLESKPQEMKDAIFYIKELKKSRKANKKASRRARRPALPAPYPYTAPAVTTTNYNPQENQQQDSVPTIIVHLLVICTVIGTISFCIWKVFFSK